MKGEENIGYEVKPLNPSLHNRAAGKILFSAGTLFSVFSMTSMIFLFVNFFKTQDKERPILETTAKLFSYYINEVMVCGVLLISALLSYLCFRAAGTVDRNIIPDKDRELLEEMIKLDEAPIDQYVRLSSLSGTTGFFTKLGLTGLPLATIGLTLIFTLLHMITKSESLFDLAKLTLGAFLGSYVQRPTASVTARRRPSASSRTKEDAAATNAETPVSSSENPYVDSGPAL